MPEAEAAEVADILGSYGLDDDSVRRAVGALRADPKRWVDFMMRFELGLDQPDPRRARSAWQTALVGGLAASAAFVIARAIS